MTRPAIDLPQALDEVIKTHQEVRLNALARTARGNGLRIADVLMALVILLALADIFLDTTRAIFPVIIAAFSIGALYISRRSRRQNAIEALRRIDGGK